MGRVTGTGCTATALVGAFLAVERDPVIAAAGALAVFGVAGELAAERSRGTGSMQVELLDALYALDWRTFAERARVDRDARRGTRGSAAETTMASRL